VQSDYDLHHQCFDATTGAPDYCGPAAYPAVADVLLRTVGAGEF